MDELKKNYSMYFPFKVTPLSGCTSMASGCIFELSDVGPFPAYQVKVTNVTDTSFTFEVITQGGFAKPGDTITFTTYEKDGDVYLQQHGVTADPVDFWDWLAQSAAENGARFVWLDMATRLTSRFHPGGADKGPGWNVP